MGSLIGWLVNRGWSERIARAAATFALFGVVLLMIAAAGAMSRCSGGRQQRAQGRVDTAQHDAGVNSAADAVNTVSVADARQRTSEDLSRRNEEEIRNAEGSNGAVNPAARDAGLRSLCRRPAYRDNPKCKLLDTPPR